MPETIRIFAYGSLLNQASLRKTVPEARNRYPAKVYGFKRIFNLASHYRFCPDKQMPVCVLNLEAADDQTALNGICFEMSESSFVALIDREQNYDMHEVTVHGYDGTGPTHTANLFWAKGHGLFSYLRDSAAQRHYLELCLSGCREFGPDFVDDFKRSTRFWGVEGEESTRRIWDGSY